jgi:hypothetical protein
VVRIIQFKKQLNLAKHGGLAALDAPKASGMGDIGLTSHKEGEREPGLQALGLVGGEERGGVGVALPLTTMDAGGFAGSTVNLRGQVEPGTEGALGDFTEFEANRFRGLFEESDALAFNVSGTFTFAAVVVAISAFLRGFGLGLGIAGGEE